MHVAESDHEEPCAGEKHAILQRHIYRRWCATAHRSQQ